MRNIVKKFSNFKKEKKANIMILYALSLFPLVAFVGLSADYAKVINSEQKLQTMADNVSLQMSALVAKNGYPTNLTQTAQQYLDRLTVSKATTNGQYSNNINPTLISVSFTDETKSNIKTVLGADIKTYFMGILSASETDIPMQATSSVKIPKYQFLDIALVLDFSGSMNSSTSTGKTRIQVLREAVDTFLTTMQGYQNVDKTNIRIGISPIQNAVSIRTTTPDFKGNTLNWATNNMSGAINAMSTNFPKPKETDATKWVAKKDTWEGYFTAAPGNYQGRAWEYIDVRGDAEFANRWIDPALFHGSLANDTDDAATGTFFESGEPFISGFSNNAHVYYVVNDDGTYYTVTSSSTPAPSATTPAYNFTVNKRPLSCLDTTGAEPFGTFVSYAGGGANDNNISNNCKAVPVWNNALWLWHLIGQEWDGCVESRAYTQNYDTSLNVTMNDPTTKYVPMAPVLKVYGNRSYVYNEYGAIGASTAITKPVISREPYHYNLGTYYYYHATGKTDPINTNWCKKLLPLQTNFQTIKDYMNASIATGYTNTTQGLFWGWELIDNGGLFDAAGPFNNSYKKVIIMITDGYPTMYKNSYGSPYENQFDPLNDDPGTSSNVVSNLVDRYKKLCTEIKNSQTGKDVIQIYAIGVDSENPYEKECVNSADNYFSVSSSALANKLADIAKKIGKVSIAE